MSDKIKSDRSIEDILHELFARCSDAYVLYVAWCNHCGCPCDKTFWDFAAETMKNEEGRE